MSKHELMFNDMDIYHLKPIYYIFNAIMYLNYLNLGASFKY